MTAGTNLDRGKYERNSRAKRRILRVVLLAAVCLLGFCFLKWMPFDWATGADKLGTTLAGGQSSV